MTCPLCGGAGVVDSGGQTPWGSWINVPCPLCHGKPITEQEVREAGWSPAEDNITTTTEAENE